MTWLLNPRTWLAVALLAALAAAFGSGWRLGSASSRAALAEAKAQHAEMLRKIADKTATAYAAVLSAREAAVQAIAEIDAEHQQELSHAKAENDDLRARARAGSVVVRIPGACSASAPGPVPGAAPAGGLGDATAEADGALRERVFDLRASIVEAQAQIGYLQDYARRCSASQP